MICPKSTFGQFLLVLPEISFRDALLSASLVDPPLESRELLTLRTRGVLALAAGTCATYWQLFGELNR